MYFLFFSSNCPTDKRTPASLCYKRLTHAVLFFNDIISGICKWCDFQDLGVIHVLSTKLLDRSKQSFSFTVSCETDCRCRDRWMTAIFISDKITIAVYPQWVIKCRPLTADAQYQKMNIAFLSALGFNEKVCMNDVKWLSWERLEIAFLWCSIIKESRSRAGPALEYKELSRLWLSLLHKGDTTCSRLCYC